MSTKPVHTINVKPLKSWKTGFANPNNEPVLMVELHDGTHLQIMMPAQTAVEMGKGLQTAGEQTLRPAGQKPN